MKFVKNPIRQKNSHSPIIAITYLCRCPCYRRSSVPTASNSPDRPNLHSNGIPTSVPHLRDTGHVGSTCKKKVSTIKHHPPHPMALWLRVFLSISQIGINLTLIILPIRTSLQGAVLSIPSGDTQARSVLTLSMLVAPRIAQFTVAELSSPGWIATATVAHATPMLATVQIAQFLRTVLSTPLRLAGARLAVQVKRPVAGTVR